jgi:hypothetical protein
VAVAGLLRALVSESPAERTHGSGERGEAAATGDPIAAPRFRECLRSEP